MVRDSESGTVTNSPAFALGGDATFKINKRMSLLVIPGEYVRAYAPGKNLNTTGRVGIVLPFYR